MGHSQFSKTDRGDSQGTGKSIRDLCHVIWQIETELKLLERSVEGVFYWPLLRLDLLFRLSYLNNQYSAGLPTSIRWAKLALHATNFLMDGPGLALGRIPKVSNIYMPTDRKEDRGGALPIHGTALEHDAAIDRLLVLYRPTLEQPVLPKSRHLTRRISAANDLGKLLGRLRRQRFRDGMRREWLEINGAMQHITGHAFPISVDEMAQASSVFAETRSIMRRLYRRSGASRLYIHAAYCLHAHVVAAQDAGIEVCEMQHGVITPYHLGYSYPGRPHVPYAPNRLLLLGRYWRDAADLPANTKTNIIGCHFLQQYHARQIAKTPSSAIVISQGVIGERLFDAAITMALGAPEWTFAFRPHPAEPVEPFMTKLASLPDAPGNLRISPPEEDFSVLLASSEVQIGVFSSGLFEGMKLGARTVLLDLPGIEYMEDVLARDEAVLAKMPEEIPSLLAAAPLSADPEKFYAQPVPSVSILLQADASS